MLMPQPQKVDVFEDEAPARVIIELVILVMSNTEINFIDVLANSWTIFETD